MSMTLTEALRDITTVDNELLARCLDEEVDFLVRHYPHEVVHIAVFMETAKRLRNG